MKSMADVMTRQEKSAIVIKALLEAEQSEVEHPEYVMMSTDEHFPNISPKEALIVLEHLSRLSGCISLEYHYRYPNEDALYNDVDLMSEIEVDAIDLRDVAPYLKEDSIQYSLGIIDFKIKIGDDFHNQLKYASKIDLIKKELPNIDDTVLELIVKSEKLYINIVQKYKRYFLRDLGRSIYFASFFDYAEKHQNTPFKLSDVGKTTYDIYNLLQRTMRDPLIYKAFFRIQGKNGAIIANFKPTYADLIAAKTSVEKIEQLVRADA